MLCDVCLQLLSDGINIADFEVGSESEVIVAVARGSGQSDEERQKECYVCAKLTLGPLQEGIVVKVTKNSSELLPESWKFSIEDDLSELGEEEEIVLDQLLPPADDGVQDGVEVDSTIGLDANLDDEIGVENVNESDWEDEGSDLVRDDTTGDEIPPSQRKVIVTPSWMSTAEYEIVERSRHSTSTGSKKTLYLAASWMKTCMSNHPACNVYRDPKWYLRRLLDVSMPEVRLIDACAAKLEGPYVTLSHCSGNEKFEVLTAENVNKYRTGVKASTLPQTFRNAIRVTRLLRIRYIWIDCYCIMQNSISGEHVVDKFIDIAQMTEVYKNCILNIAAAHGVNPNDRCFIYGEHSLVTRSESFFALTPDGDKSQKRYHVHHSSDVTKHVAEFLNANIFLRAWVLQERLLSPRTLSFGMTEIFWESIYPQDSEKNYDRWVRVVSEYMETILSYPREDKLVALGGIAKLVTEALDDLYIAGLFRRDLVRQMCWTAHDKAKSALEWRGPSWSWVSIDGPVFFPMESRRDQTELICIDEVNIELTDPNNPYGPINSASLTVRGLFIPIDFAPEKSDATQDTTPTEQPTFEDEEIDEITHEELEVYDVNDDLEEAMRILSPTFDVESPQGPGEIALEDTLQVRFDNRKESKQNFLYSDGSSCKIRRYILPIMWEDIPDNRACHCMLLEEASPNTYLRCGYTAPFDEQADGFFADWKEFWSEEPKETFTLI